MFFPKILIRSYEEEVFRDRPFKRKKGEIIHFILANIYSYDDIEKIQEIVENALAYFGEKRHKWDIKRDFIFPILEIFKISQVKALFNQPGYCTYIERDILVPLKNGFNLIRPDRVVVRDNEVIVVEFKSEYSKDVYNKHLSQVKEYMYVVRKIFNKYTKGFLIYILSKKVIPIL